MGVLSERMEAALLALRPDEATPPHVIGAHHGETWNALERRGLVEWAPQLADDDYDLLLTPTGVELRAETLKRNHTATLICALLYYGAACADSSLCVAALEDLGVEDAAQRVEALRAVKEARGGRVAGMEAALLRGES